jgi:hypothetical protein
MAIMIDPGPKTCRADWNYADADQLKQSLAKEVLSMESNGMLTWVERPLGDATPIKSRWVIGRKLLANGHTEKWKFRLVGHGEQ